jgi:hypothetical protein
MDRYVGVLCVYCITKSPDNMLSSGKRSLLILDVSQTCLEASDGIVDKSIESICFAFTRRSKNALRLPFTVTCLFCACASGVLGIYGIFY